MEKVHPWSGQPSDRGRLKDRTEQKFQVEDEAQAALEMCDQLLLNASSKDDAMLACFCLAKLSAR